MRLLCYLISLANLAIGSVQSMAVVINVMCIFKNVGGVKLTAVQGANTLIFGPLYLLTNQFVEMMDTHRCKGLQLVLQTVCRVRIVKSVTSPLGLIKLLV